MKNIIKKYPILDGYFQFSQFNAFQTQCLPKIMDKQENIIVCAPTSSGKTVLFQFAILKYLHLSSPMCLYLAPIKSLCHEKLKVWRQKFSKKAKIAEITGDNIQDNPEDYLNSNIAIGTPQKIDFLSRQSLEYLKKIRLLLIDQIHMLNVEERGATLEAIVSRIMSLNKNVRIIAVSASIPNIYQVGQWLKVPKGSICTFGEEYRPAKLNKIVLGFKCGKQHFTFEKSLNFKLLEIVRMYSNGKGCLIFCPTQKGTNQACQAIINQMKDRQFIQNDKQIVSLVTASNQISNYNLQVMLTQGIAFHNAGLSMQDRSLVQKLFLQRKIKILCTTSTLSMGINLPAHLVIIKSTLTYRGSAKGFQQYTRIQIDQMTGRAGRPPFDTQGTVVIMTDKSNFNRYNGKLQLQDLQSQLFTQMLEHINAEISLGSIQCLLDVQDYLKNSFCYIRMKKSPKNYGITGNLDDYISQSSKKAVISLSQLSIINFNPETQRIYAKQLSNSISKSSVYIKSIVNITKIANNSLNQRQYLSILCQCEQINRFTSKIQERDYLKKLNQKNKYSYKLKESISNAEKKCFVLIQAQLSKINIQHWELRRQATDILFCLKRLNYCIKTLAIELKVFWMYYWSIRFVKYFNFKFWDQAGVKLLAQFTGLEDRQKYFTTQGLKSIADLKNNLSSLENWFQKGPQFLSIIQEQLLYYQDCIDILLSTDKTSHMFYLKIKLKGNMNDKLKGINICIGDSNNKLYYYKYLDTHNIQVNINISKNNGASYKIGIIKEGIIGFDEFYVIQNGNLIKKNIDATNENEGKAIKNRKSVENIKSAIKNEQSIEKKNKTFQKNSNARQNFAKNIMNKFKKQKKTSQMNNNMDDYGQLKIDEKGIKDDQSFDKRSVQLKLPSNYRVRQPVIKNVQQQYQLVDKKVIKKSEQFKFKPLNQYKWKPGFEQIHSQSEEQVKISKKLRLVESKDKKNIFENKIQTNPFKTVQALNHESFNMYQKKNNIIQPKQTSSIIMFDKINNFNNNNIDLRRQSKQKKQTQKQDVFSYFYNLF